MNRRDFIKGAALLGGAAQMGCKSLIGFKRGINEDLAVFLSDIHVDGRAQGVSLQDELLNRCIDEILGNDELPAHVFLLGDIAVDVGLKADYERVRPFFKRITDAGIQLHLTMGNHDHRAAFYEVFPEYKERSPVPGKLVEVVHLKHLDIILFDSLKDDVSKPDAYNQVAGTFNDDVYDWMASELPRWSRPVILCSHHPISEIFKVDAEGNPIKGSSLKSFYEKNPNLIGYICGHRHCWTPAWTRRMGCDNKEYRILVIPSASWYGEIGYAYFRMSENIATAELQIRDFFVHPIERPKPRSKLAQMIIKEDQGSTCSFCY